MTSIDSLGIIVSQQQPCFLLRAIFVVAVQNRSYRRETMTIICLIWRVTSYNILSFLIYSCNICLFGLHDTHLTINIFNHILVQKSRNFGIINTHFPHDNVFSYNITKRIWSKLIAFAMINFTRTVMFPTPAKSLSAIRTARFLQPTCHCNILWPVTKKKW